LVAFSGNASAQQLVARLLGDTRLGERRMLFLLDTIGANAVRQFPELWKEPLAGLLSGPNSAVRMRVVELIRARALSGFEGQLQSLSRDTAAQDQLRALAMSVLVMSNPRLAPDQFSFLRSRLGPESDAVLRQTVAGVIGSSAPDRNELLEIARTRLGNAD